MKKEELLDKQFHITSVCREDLKHTGMTERQVLKVSDSDMRIIADKMADAFCETDSYWLALEEAVNYLKKYAKV